MTRRERFLNLRDHAPVILPSLLLCDFTNLEREVARLEQADVKALHLDVMDGRFVPNFTYGMPIVEAFRQLTDLPLDVHLMMECPDQYLKRFFDAGADAICLVCPFCAVMYDSTQKSIENEFGKSYRLPVLYLPQILGLAMGYDRKELGLNINVVKTKHLNF